MSFEKCLKIAIEAHKGQKRKNGEDYINHPIRVSDIFSGNTFLKSIAILHDVLEDTGMDEGDLRSKDVDENVIEVVKILTRKKDENYFDFIIRISKNKDAACIKIVDINDNITDLEESSMKDKYRLARYILRKVLESEI